MITGHMGASLIHPVIGLLDKLPRDGSCATSCQVIGNGASVVGAGFEPAKAEPTGLQPVPFDRSGTPP